MGLPSWECDEAGRSTEEQVTYALRQYEAGKRAADICRQRGVSEATFYVWKMKYAQMGVDELGELRQLREENARFKRVVADLTLDKQILTDFVKSLEAASRRALAGRVLERYCV